MWVSFFCFDVISLTNRSAKNGTIVLYRTSLSDLLLYVKTLGCEKVCETVHLNRFRYCSILNIDRISVCYSEQLAISEQIITCYFKVFKTKKTQLFILNNPQFNCLICILCAESQPIQNLCIRKESFDSPDSFVF